MQDETFCEEQRHLSDVYAQIVSLRDELAQEIARSEQAAAQDLLTLSEELRPDVAGVEADETMETLAAIETLNAVIDAYNQRHDFVAERLGRVLVLERQPYFAKVRLKMRPGRPERDVYIGAVGLTDRDRRPLVVDWRSPVAETYYKQDMGPTSFTVDGRVRNVELTLRRQFDIERDVLKMYFDTTVAIEDSLLLKALRSHHSEKLEAITATIQREQNEVVRHEDVDALLVAGVAGSGKTSVMLQRVAYLFYQERDRLDPDQVVLLTPNDVFGRYIDSVLPSLGERNPQVLTWRSFVASLGLEGRDPGADTDPEVLLALELAAGTLEVGIDDVRDVTVEGQVLLKASQVISCLDKFSRFEMGPRRLALARDEMHSRIERRISTLARRYELQEEMLSLDVDEQTEVFGETVSPEDERETVALTRTYLAWRYAAAHELVDDLAWLRLDRLAEQVLSRSLNACEWLWLRLLLTNEGDKRVRYVMVDEIQDYTRSQLMLLHRHFGRAHFLMLGDEMQAIRAGSASFDEIREVFCGAKGGLAECALRTSYRSSPEITELFSSLMEDGGRSVASSVRRAGTKARVQAFEDTDAYLSALASAAEAAKDDEGLCAFVCADARRASWLSRKLGGLVSLVRRSSSLPATGVVVLDLALAKGLEFDHVIVPDAQVGVYGTDDLSRRRLYTAISRAMHKVEVFSQGEMTPLLDAWRTSHEERA